MKILTTSKGIKFKVSSIDHNFIKQCKWYYDGRYIRNGKIGLLHRVIMERIISKEIPSGLEVDHLNGLKIDSRRENLRLATPSQNRINSSKRIGESGFKGVRQQSGRENWRSEITINGKKIWIGCFPTAREAAIAYNNKAFELYGEFACLNKVTLVP